MRTPAEPPTNSDADVYEVDVFEDWADEDGWQ